MNKEELLLKQVIELQVNIDSQINQLVALLDSCQSMLKRATNEAQKHFIMGLISAYETTIGLLSNNIEIIQRQEKELN